MSMDNIRLIEKIFYVEKCIFNCMDSLIDYKLKNNFVGYEAEMKKMRLFVKKENAIFSKLPKDSTEIFLIKDYMFDLADSILKDAESKNFILSRLTCYLQDQSDIYADQENKVLFDIEDEDIEFDYLPRIKIRKNLTAKFISYLELNSNYSMDFSKSYFRMVFSTLFERKDLFDELVEHDFDLKKMKILSDEELMKNTSISEPSFDYLIRDESYNYVLDTLNDIFLDYSNPFSEKDFRLVQEVTRFKFLLELLDIDQLLMLNSQYKSLVSKFDDVHNIFGNFGKMINLCIACHPDCPKAPIEPNVSRQSLDDKELNNLVYLIKLEEKILNFYKSLDINKSLSPREFNLLKGYIAAEKETAKMIDLDESKMDLVNLILMEGLPFYLSDDSISTLNQALICQRIYNVIPYFYNLNVSPSQTKDCYESIYRNHMLNSLEKYRKKFSNYSDDKKKYFEDVYSGIFYTNPLLFDELLAVLGNHLVLSSLSDSLSAESVDLDLDEYIYDKNDQLYEYGRIVIADLMSFSDDYKDDLSKFALFEFKLCELSDIIESVDEAFLPEFISMLDDYLSLDNIKVTRKVFRKITHPKNIR